MKTERHILIACILNLSFSVFEFVGGIITGSIAIVSDAVHDAGDAISIGISYFLEKKSKKRPDNDYTYGYARYSVIGGCMTTLILLLGSVTVIYNAVNRIITPTVIHYNSMIVFAVVGVCVNFCATVFTHGGDSINQKAVNLHMLEDVLGWVAVLIGAIVMRFTEITLLDPLMSIGVSVFVLVNAIRNLKEAVDVFLEKAPPTIRVEEIKEHIEEMDGVLDVHHIHLWSMDGQSHYATLHVVTDIEPCAAKKAIRKNLYAHGIQHVTIEVETTTEKCCDKQCRVTSRVHSENSHHHHVHHSH